ncbi:leucine-rich repeat domain-containing protein [Streptomyces sp. NPDC001948]
MTTVTSPAGYRVLSVVETEERFAASSELAYPYQDFADEQEIRLYEGGLHVAGSLEPESEGDRVPYNVIVDGDLTVDGDLEWWGGLSGCFLLVTGNVRARNVLLSGCPEVVVCGDLTAIGTVQGHHGDDGGYLTVQGSIRAEAVISTLYFNLDLARQPEALLVADPCRTTCPVDFTDDELGGIVLLELLDEDGRADEYGISEALRAGQPVLGPGARPSHLAVQDELEALLPRAAEITELDLSRRKLRQIPGQLFAFPGLRRLSLAGNEYLGTLDDRIGELTALEELDIADTGLTELPRAIGSLRELRVLDISGNRFESLPEEIGDLAQLEKLRARGLTCPVPETVGRLRALRELDLSGMHAPGRSPLDFPLPVTRLTGLRALGLMHVWLDSVPDELLALAGLEELDLRGSLSARLERLPDLARLPRLRVLRLSGNTRWTYQPEPDRNLLSAVWAVTTLEELEIDRWGERTLRDQVVRTALTALPDDAFARMPGLRRLDLSFNELTVLPESFFRLAHLEAVDLRYTKLSRPVLDRLRDELPHVRLER